MSDYFVRAATCNVNEITQGHPPALTSGTGQYTITTSKSGTSFTFTLAGPKAIKGLLLYTLDGSTSTRTGEFTIPDNFQSKSCNGDGINTLTHTNNNDKSLPLTFTWKPHDDTTKSVTIKSLVVVSSAADWYQLDDVTLDLSSGTSNVTTPSDSGSNDSDGFFKNYTLFVILAILNIIIYIAGVAVEYMLRRQNVNAKKVVKNI
ncbi:12016_t:CDS:2 [Diversispora eburnea]|uniref:12016_t:CDS:1 n=1 Tax=Diversispora eburnea TaxID=1213867 RepID=A0A9N9AQ14_9GLOM|nr:12016_t:CDS:2 [Diversispora eburnea]